MRTKPGNIAKLDITIPRLWWAAFAAVVPFAPAAGQLIDTTLEDVVQQQIDRQVEDQVAEALENSVVQQLGEQVEAQVTDAVQQTVESSVTSTVASTVEQAIEGEVVEAVQQQIANGVTETIGDTIQSTVETVIEQAIELGDGVQDVAEGIADAPAPDATEPFLADLDTLGSGIEREVWVILVPEEFAARIDGWGFTIRERRNLESLDRVLLRVAAPEDRDIAQAALDLALDAPGTLVDFNHVYRGSAGETETADGIQVKPNASPPIPATTSLGIIDSGVDVTHEALREAAIEQRDFVPFVGPRPLQHGTAVASILVGSGRGIDARLPSAKLYAAGVFFADEKGAPAATTASLVAGLEWLAAQRVRVVNMSLSGPPNRVLEAAIGAVAAQGVVMTAAVGNNGPAGEPLYPAAYDTVVGVTAVDAGHRIYRYANRGPHVAFAAPGVRIKVARSDGGYATESGTSMAAPYAAAIVARSLADRPTATPEEVLRALRAAALDLGAASFDDVYGFGLITPLADSELRAEAH
jgi:subtilisin family serine protease